MSVRIETRPEDSKTTLRIQGRLAGSDVPELLRASRSIKGLIVLDLTDLQSADPDGIKAIQHLVRGGAELRGVSPFVRILLDDEPTLNADLSAAVFAATEVSP